MKEEQVTDSMGDTAMNTIRADRFTFGSAQSLVNTEAQPQPIPFLWFDDNTEEALYFFVSEFHTNRN
jgi:hypothetical protein